MVSVKSIIGRHKLRLLPPVMDYDFLSFLIVSTATSLTVVLCAGFVLVLRRLLISQRERERERDCSQVTPR